MGKSDKIQMKGSCAFKRINYLYQAAILALEQNSKNTELVRFYAHTLRSVAKREVLRIHPDIKRQLCKKCFMLLVPGVTSTVRVRGNRQKHTVIRCMDCGTVKRFVADKNYQLHVSNPEVLNSSIIGSSNQSKQHQEQKEQDSKSSSQMGANVEHNKNSNKCKNSPKFKTEAVVSCGKRGSVTSRTDFSQAEIGKDIINGVNGVLHDCNVR